ncbi:hypothetical protein BDQ17DRAFT_1419983 [Cyathus striatus]|nr:hypothetical protein BDQ17DRAFT_1419983 [Cyathus striatus]
MRAAFELYEHPELTSSQIWQKGGKERFYAVIGTLSLAAVSTAAVYTYTDIANSLQGSPMLRRWL